MLVWRDVKEELFDIIDSYQDILLRVRSYKEQNFCLSERIRGVWQKYCTEMLEVRSEFEQLGV